MGKVKRKPREPLPEDPFERAIEKKRRNRESAQKLRNNKNSDVSDMELTIESLEREQARLLDVSRNEEAKQDHLRRLLTYFKAFTDDASFASPSTFSSSASSASASSSPPSPSSPSSSSSLSPHALSPEVLMSQLFQQQLSSSSSFSSSSSSPSVSSAFSAESEQGSEAALTTTKFSGTTSAPESVASSPAASSFSSTHASPLPKGVDLLTMLQVMCMFSFIPSMAFGGASPSTLPPSPSPAPAMQALMAACAASTGSYSPLSTLSPHIWSPRPTNIPTT